MKTFLNIARNFKRDGGGEIKKVIEEVNMIKHCVVN
jgi:hypothetical protein